MIWAMVKNKMVSQEKLNRIFWHSRRGMLELDLILVPFVRDHFPAISEADQMRYEQLLACEDQDMFSWFMRSSIPEDAEIAAIVGLILESR
jgi:antitoxin CptB